MVSMTEPPRIIEYRCRVTGKVYEVAVPPLDWPEPITGPEGHILEPMLGLDPSERGSAIAPGSRGPGISVPDHATSYRAKLPISNSLPRRKITDGVRDTHFGHDVVRHKDGGLTDLHGRPIIDSKEADRRESRRTGFERVGRGEPDPPEPSDTEGE